MAFLKALTKASESFFWNAGGLNNAKFTDLKTILYQHDADVFIIVEAGESTDFPQFYEVNNFTTHVLRRSRQVASGILVGVWVSTRNSVAISI